MSPVHLSSIPYTRHTVWPALVFQLAITEAEVPAKMHASTRDPSGRYVVHHRYHFCWCRKARYVAGRDFYLLEQITNEDRVPVPNVGRWLHSFAKYRRSGRALVPRGITSVLLHLVYRSHM